MRINKKERLQTAVDKLEDIYDKVSDDLYSLIQNNNISKSYIAKDIDIFKNQLQYVEKILKIYQEVQMRAEYKVPRWVKKKIENELYA